MKLDNKYIEKVKIRLLWFILISLIGFILLLYFFYKYEKMNDIIFLHPVLIYF